MACGVEPACVFASELNIRIMKSRTSKRKTVDCAETDISAVTVFRHGTDVRGCNGVIEGLCVY